MKHIDIINAATDLGVCIDGASLGPETITKDLDKKFINEIYTVKSQNVKKEYSKENKKKNLDSINEFNNSLKYIEEICDQYPQYKIVVVTHHCPSIKCISSHYRAGDCNQAYASDLESFIKNHNNIVCWVCGHSHNSCDFKIDGCRVIMNCRGYVMYGENFRFDPNKKIYI